jgi:hypothetical protein
VSGDISAFQREKENDMWKHLTVAAVVVLLASACLLTEVDSTLYLDPDGSLTWSVLEDGIVSDKQGEAGLLEEQEYLDAFETKQHGIAEMMFAMGPSTVETKMIRNERPYSTFTSARYPDVGEFFQRMIDYGEERGRARLINLGEFNRLEIEIQLERERTSTPAEDFEEKPLPILDRDDFPFVLTGGEFVAAEGFEIAKGGQTALPLEYEDEEIEEMLEAGVIVYSLTWTTQTSR